MTRVDKKYEEEKIGPGVIAPATIYGIAWAQPAIDTIYSLVRLVWPNTEELISRPFVGL